MLHGDTKLIIGVCKSCHMEHAIRIFKKFPRMLCPNPVEYIIVWIWSHCRVGALSWQERPFDDCINIKCHDDVIKWKHFPRYWPFVRGIHRSTVNSPHKGQWRGALMFSLICTWINDCVINRKAGDLRRHCAHYYVTVMYMPIILLRRGLLTIPKWT